MGGCLEHQESRKPKRSRKFTSQCAENARDTPDCVFMFFSLAPCNSRAYKETVSSWSSGGLHESTGLRSARQLNTPLLRCESRTNRLKANPLVKRRSKRKKEGPHGGPSSYLDSSDFGLPAGLRQVSPYFYISKLWMVCLELSCRLMWGVLVFAVVFSGVMPPLMMLRRMLR
jgi:hypothetical protein